MSLPQDSGDRRPSIAERASAVIEAAKMRKSSLLSNVGYSQNSLGLVKDGEEFSMNPEDYDLKQVIGQGSSATVYLAIYKPSQKFVSIKVIDLDMFERNQIDELRRELQIMTLSRHPNLLPVFGSFVNGSKLFIVTPFLSGGSGLDIMKTAYQKGMEESIIATILKQVLQGLEYLHSHGLIHRDIKAGNLLVHNDGLVQLADFGVSSSLTDHGSRGTSRKTFVGTPCWMAPEVMDQSGYDYKADIWSFGITALELANGHAPYAKFPPMKVLMLTLQNPPPTLDRDRTFHKYSKSFKDMIDLCLQKEPQKRPTAEKLLAHPFFKSAKKPQYLTTTLLQGLTPITERKHLSSQRTEKEQEDTQHTNEEWDFDDPASPRPLSPPSEAQHQASEDSLAKPRAVSFGEEFGERGNITRKDTVASATSLTEDSIRSDTGRVSFTEKVNVQEPAIIPKKSRFVVDNPNVTSQSQRTDSSSSAVEIVPVSSPQLPAEVKKGRFSVIDNPNQPQVPASERQSSASLASNLAQNQGSLTVPAVPGAASTSPLISPSQSSTMIDPLPIDSSSSTELPNLVERKAGRFAFQNLPTSAVTSPVLSATEGPKIPRKFTIVSETSSTTSPAGGTTSEKKSRFQVVDGNDSHIIDAACNLLLEPTPVPSPTDPDSIQALLKQNETQRKCIQDLLSILAKNAKPIE